MISAMRYTVLIFGVLAVAMVLAMAGDGACGTCLYGCCVRTSRSRGIAAVKRRIAGVLRGLVEAIAASTTSVLRLTTGQSSLGTQIFAAVSLLRI